MKIVHIITRMILGGAQENTLLTCEGLHLRGHEVTLITGPTYGPEGQLLARAQRGGYRVIETPRLVRPIRPLKDWLCRADVQNLLRDLAPDIVHTHSAKAGMLGRLAAAAVRNEATDGCCATIRKFRAAQLATCRLRPRIVHTIHGLAFHPYLSALKNRLYIAAERRAAGVTDAFISVAQAMTDQALAAGIGRPEQYTRIFSGMETAAYLADPPAEQVRQLRAGHDLPADALVVVTVARLAEFKGHEYVIEAARELTKRHPRLYFLFVGDGYWRARIERQIAAAGLTERFRLVGLVAPEKVPEYIHASDILVHCSLREGLARVLPQALLCGKPAVSFDVDGAREVVIPGETGYLLPPQQTPPLVEALDTLLKDAAMRSRLGGNGRERCRTDFDHERMVAKIEEVYERLL